jgi:hypothetical protein
MYFLLVGLRPGHAADLVGRGPPRLAAGFLPRLGDAHAPFPADDGDRAGRRPTGCGRRHIAV